MVDLMVVRGGEAWGRGSRSSAARMTQQRGCCAMDTRASSAA